MPTENEPEQAEGGEEVDEESGGAAAGGFGGAAEVGELGVRSEDGQVRQGRGVHRRQADPRKEIRLVECCVRNIWYKLVLCRCV